MITFDSVTKTYTGQSQAALSDVNVDIDKGEFVFLVGQSGSGKSTFIRLILREYRPTRGTLYVAGKNLNQLRSWKVPALRRQIGTVFQDFRLLPRKTVYENVAFAMQVIGKPTKEIRSVVPETLELVGLDGKQKRMPDELSGGEQQRVAIARAFAAEPDVLFADEPTGNLDTHTGAHITELLFELNRERGTTLVLVTHDERLARRCHRVLRLEGGRQIASETSE